jgi:hypothetical protein
MEVEAEGTAVVRFGSRPLAGLFAQGDHLETLTAALEAVTGERYRVRVTGPLAVG